jgi:hypothetical protein
MALAMLGAIVMIIVIRIVNKRKKQNDISF